MSRYIEEDALIKNIAKIDLRRLSTKTIGQAIHETPTADVQEVRHGQWLRKAETFGYYVDYFCSECGNKKSDNSYKYCDECGAKMDK